MSLHGTANGFDKQGNLVEVSPFTRQAIESARIQREGNARRRTGLHVSGPLNSTKFTNCCGAAVVRDERTCPACGTSVFR